MQAYRDLLSSDQFAKLLGIKVVEVGDGYARLQMQLTEDHMNFFGTAHGGAIFALADASFGAAANADGFVTAAIHVSIDYLSAAHPGAILEVCCTQNLTGGRVGHYTMVVKDEQGTLIALCNGWARRTQRPLIPEEGGSAG